MKIITLVMKAQNGNEKAYIQLFQQFEEDIYRTAYVYVQNQEDALDVVQEVAYRSFKSIGGLKEPQYFKTWLIRIAITCAIDLLRQRKKVLQLRTEHTEFIGEEDEDLSLSVSLRDLLEGLDENEKSIVILRFYHDYTIREVAQMVNIPLGTTKTILYRALNKLRQRLKEEEDK